MDINQQIKIVLDQNGQQVVQMNMEVFKAIESYIEDQGLLAAILENKSEDKLNSEDALEFYAKLQKAA